MNPRVSVVIPTYNRLEKVGNTIDSALAQTFSDIEVVVVDDGSSDDTGRLLAKDYGNRIRYYYQPNQGVSVARNRGISEARGNWIAFLDSDDLWEKDKLEWQLRTLEQFRPQVGVCYTDARLINHIETRTLFQMSEDSYHHTGIVGANRDVLKLLVRPGGAGMVVCVCSVLARADLIRRTGGFDTRLQYGEDSEFLFRLATLTDFCYVNLPLIRIDRSPADVRHVGVSTDWDRLEFILQQSQVRLEGLMRLGNSVPFKVRKLIQEQLASVQSGLTNSHLGNGDYEKARAAVWKAVRLDLTFNVAVKCLLTWTSPRLARRTVLRHLQRKKEPLPVI